MGVPFVVGQQGAKKRTRGTVNDPEPGNTSKADFDCPFFFAILHFFPDFDKICDLLSFCVCVCFFSDNFSISVDRFLALSWCPRPPTAKRPHLGVCPKQLADVRRRGLERHVAHHQLEGVGARRRFPELETPGLEGGGLLGTSFC